MRVHCWVHRPSWQITSTGCELGDREPDLAQARTVKVIPAAALVLMIHYRTPFTSSWEFGSRNFRQPEYRHYATSGAGLSETLFRCCSW